MALTQLRIVVVCKVIDNFGDAGFCLRLGRSFAHLGHSVCIAHDNATVFSCLHDPKECPTLLLIDTTTHNVVKSISLVLQCPDVILEPFASSSEQTTHRFDGTLKLQWPKAPWLAIEYLSAEAWVEAFHLQPSCNPQTQHRSTYFFPGFSPNTGGLIHKDTPNHQTKQDIEKNRLRIFVFCYPSAPTLALQQACQHHADLYIPQQFVPQWRFDDVLNQHDVLFVRGEDSFVRAQLAGKPFVWHIYPCQDQSHVKKLMAFFERYTENLEPKAKQALWVLWTFWNNLEYNTPTSQEHVQKAWNDFYQYLPTYQEHARTWQHKLRQGKDLIAEVLQWYQSTRTP